MNKNAVTIVLALVLIAVTAFFAANYKQGKEAIKKSRSEVVNKAIEYVRKNLVDSSVSVSLAQIYNDDDEDCFYTFQVDVMGNLYDFVVTADGSKLFTDSGIDLNEILAERLDGNFLVKEDAEIIEEDGKPVIFLFTTEDCPYCAWEQPVLEEVVESFGDAIVYKLRQGVLEDQEVFEEFGDGGVPLIVLGGKYYRIGAGVQAGEELEKEYLTTHICNLTGGIPESICE
ncbi:MAG: thioredoxin family protein [Candidatus Pacebacteria bacterium]|jgi:thiol-disulfide isomerase/thioredoxin|nr:thioredoxin family protein [Candidatus Paceibacterota bacterium]MDD2796597.1 thioredoxin family protein [Candidatus Paceibacterota bacterium]MDD3047905.1 thioredoxin family protein [Candidatus Paceibacterota bacterium]MDD3509996.1 thioredoxin family protein [Candidatus Paceibacterota bacterium]MDD3918521.1 thioredoxin family protein [Candidatus Paceibacterota bacterium]